MIIVLRMRLTFQKDKSNSSFGATAAALYTKPHFWEENWWDEASMVGMMVPILSYQQRRPHTWSTGAATPWSFCVHKRWWWWCPETLFFFFSHSCFWNPFFLTDQMPQDNISRPLEHKRLGFLTESTQKQGERMSNY